MLNWQFSNCIGVLDGRHIEIEKPCFGSQYHNYKQFFNIVLLVLCDANKFTWMDEVYLMYITDSINDGSVWRNSELAADFASDNADLSSLLPKRDVPFSHAIVANEAFLLNTSVFNYRLNRACLCIENTFGILVSRWHKFYTNDCVFL
ncbi:hypothetical protein ACFW04_000222 [Cataglyphis niger]